MKKLFIIISCLCVALGGYAQDDDVYFVPKKNKKSTHVEVQQAVPVDYDYSNSEVLEYDTWADGNSYSEEDIDAYNRRYRNDTTDTDTAYAAAEMYAEDDVQGTYTARLVRFHSPRVGILVSSPYYVDYYDLWYSPWHYDPWYGYPYWYGYGWCHSSWYWGWGYNHWDWYWGWGCPSYWWGNHHHHHYYPHYPHYPNYPHYASGNRGPHGGWVDRYRTNTNNRYAASNRVNGNRNSRAYNSNSNYRPSREFGNRNYNSTNRNGVNKPNTNRYQGTSTSTRQFGNTSRPATTTRTTTTRSYNNTNSSRSYNNSSSSRSYNSSSSSFSRSYSTGGGSGRSFGGGGGARGGRR